MSILYKNDIKRILPLLQEMEEGKTLQIKTRNGWIDVDADKYGINIDYLLNDRIIVRIKQEPKYRPFKDAEECFEEMQKHKPYGWVKDASKMYNITIIRDDGIIVNTSIDGGFYNFKSSLNLKFVDGTPFGIKKE